MKQKATYRKPQIGKFISAMCDQYSLDPMQVKAFLFGQFPELKDQKHCANCSASMREYPCSMTVLCAELLCEMATFVEKGIEAGLPPQIANQIHRKRIKGGYTIASQFTIASKLGLIAKVMHKVGKKEVHDMEKGWLITKRGFDFLAGKPVPARVTVFRGIIQERYDETITMSELYKQTPVKAEEYRDRANYIINKFNEPKLL